MSLDDKVKSLISMGSEITGPASGSAIGFLIGGPGGAALGGLSGVIISKSLSDIIGRLLSNREKVRVGVTATYAITKVKAHLDSGYELRNDGFFQEGERGRSNAEEIFEGVLLKAKNEHEEKKTRILGNIFANIAFSTGFSVGEANHLLRIAENLTYRDMCILSLIKRKDEINGIKLSRDRYGEEHAIGDVITLDFSTAKASVLQQVYELCNRGLAICASGEADITMLATAYDVIPDELALTIMGSKYYEIMDLDDIPEEDIREAARYLR